MAKRIIHLRRGPLINWVEVRRKHWFFWVTEASWWYEDDGIRKAQQFIKEIESVENPHET